MTTEKYTRFEPADYLVDIDDVAAYLQIALEERPRTPPPCPVPWG